MSRQAYQTPEFDALLLAACRKASDASRAEGRYGRRGWFSGRDVWVQNGPRYFTDDLQRLARDGHLVEGTEADRLDISTSACIFRLPDVDTSRVEGVIPRPFAPR